MLEKKIMVNIFSYENKKIQLSKYKNNFEPQN